jgi:hypothetical protein
MSEKMVHLGKIFPNPLDKFLEFDIIDVDNICKEGEPASLHFALEEDRNGCEKYCSIDKRRGCPRHERCGARGGALRPVL